MEADSDEEPLESNQVVEEGGGGAAQTVEPESMSYPGEHGQVMDTEADGMGYRVQGTFSHHTRYNT